MSDANNIYKLYLEQYSMAGELVKITLELNAEAVQKIEDPN